MAFTYAPLQRDQREIRLVILEPGTDGCTPIRLSLETTPLDLAGKYTCLSYAWGPPSPQKSVELNGCRFDLRENLYLALKRLRLPDKARRLWVDAVCINQNDIHEREDQVSIMQHIYHTASDVIAWIGEDNGEPDRRAIAFMKELSARSKSSIHVDPEDSDSALGFARPTAPLDDESVDWLESVTPFGLVDSVWLDLAALIDRPWFSRIWIVQEVVLGKQVMVQCGPHQFDWIELFYCAIFVKEHAEIIRAMAAPDCLKFHDPKKAAFYMKSLPMDRLLNATNRIDSVGYLASRRRMQTMVQTLAESAFKQHLAQTEQSNSPPDTDQTPWTLHTLTTRFRPFASTDPRDKIYALLGIASEVLNLPASTFPAISYAPDTKVVDVLWEVITSELQDKRDLGFLRGAAGLNCDNQEGYPSWMPLWYHESGEGARGMAVQFAEVEDSAVGVRYRASGGLKATVMGLDKERKEVSVAGVLVGRVKEGGLGEVYDQDVEREERWAVRRRWAEMLGFGEVEKLAQVLMALRMNGQMGDEEAEERLEGVLGKLPAGARAVYSRFEGTVMASATDEGTQRLLYPPADAKVSGLAKMLGGGKRPRHFTHPMQLNVEGRVSTVCHGRRLFVCDKAGGSGQNFGLCPSKTQEGDFVALLVGSNVLHIIRQLEIVDGLPVFGLVGEAYVHNWMDGQLLNRVKVPGYPELLKVNTITLR
ncbi:hypothetical protein NEMBOFW57_010644 [Staphylotrichum longicolle]|uniref:Heterokaryon incompatibility domain-containing protein n=1 Tax=Staphylotrichum longicolle TaxID=669026 RepID=A0AAD4EN43_9PEZI|nr:hypothetical protein NEMBOFW57_010644 [Staphylotrichum longicolle]